MNIEANKLSVKKAECSGCSGMRNCTILHCYDENGDDGYAQWHTAWLLLKCNGCDFVFAQKVSSNSEDYEQSYDSVGNTITEYTETIKYWPALSKRKRPEWLGSISFIFGEYEKLAKALDEVYGALDNDLSMLAAIGIRTSFDIASELLNINSEQPFQSKLADLAAAGHISKVDEVSLDALVDAGSASAHRGWRPTAENLNTMMDILEQFVYGAFALPENKKRIEGQAIKMKAKVPQRKSGKEISISN